MDVNGSDANHAPVGQRNSAAERHNTLPGDGVHVGRGKDSAPGVRGGADVPGALGPVVVGGDGDSGVHGVEAVAGGDVGTDDGGSAAAAVLGYLAPEGVEMCD